MDVERGAFSVVDNSAEVPEFSGPEASELAGVSYRQLDHWARQGWVLPSRGPGARVPRRVYTSAEVRNDPVAAEKAS